MSLALFAILVLGVVTALAAWLVVLLAGAAFVLRIASWFRQAPEQLPEPSARSGVPSSAPVSAF